MKESIRYAGMLQQSILPNERIFKNNFHDAFVLFQPRDIVSGDFYFVEGSEPANNSNGIAHCYDF